MSEVRTVRTAETVRCTHQEESKEKATKTRICRPQPMGQGRLPPDFENVFSWDLHLPGGGSIKVRPGRCRNGHDHSRDPVAHREHKPLHEAAHAGVADHGQVACREEEVQTRQQHPGEGGQVEIV